MPLCKTGDTTDYNNYKGMCFLNSGYKIRTELSKVKLHTEN